MDETAAQAIQEPTPEQKKLRAISEQRAIIADRVRKLEDAKARHSEAKAAYDSAVSQLLRVIDEDDKQGELPFEVEHDTEDWRAFPVAQLGLPEKLVDAMAEAELFNVGDVNDFTMSGKRFIDIKGIGQAKAEKIDDALLKFWQDHPEYTRPEPKPEEEPAAEAEAA
jgi:hypothetical protein